MSRPASIENAPRGTHEAPVVEPRAGESPRRFVVALLVAALALVALVGGVNAIVDPYGTTGTGLFPTATFSDRSIKVGLIAKLKTPPQLVVLGSSRSMKVEPAYLTRKTGLPAFNAGVSSGRPEDVWAFTNLLHDSVPGTRQRYLWLLDVEAFRTVPLDAGLVNEPKLSRYFPASYARSTRVAGLADLFSLQALQDSWRVIRAEVSGTASKPRVEFDADGWRRKDFHDLGEAQGRSFKAELAASLRQYTRTYAGGGYAALADRPKQYFEKTLALMNGFGAEPVIVLTPVHPVLKARIGPLGWNARHREVLAFVRSLQGRYRFRVVDLTDIATFGGDAGGFYDGVHMKVPNMRRLIDRALAASDGALK